MWYAYGLDDRGEVAIFFLVLVIRSLANPLLVDMVELQKS